MLYQLTNELVFGMLLVFCRIGSALAFMPLFSEVNISTQFRLLFALVISYSFVQMVGISMPAIPTSFIDLSLLITFEILLGIMMGIIAKTVISALHTTGMIIAFQSGLSSGMIFDPMQGAQSSIFGNILSIAFMATLFSYDGHLYIIKTLASSYSMFGVGSYVDFFHDFTETFMKAVSNAFNVGVKLAIPFIIVGFVFFLGAGVLSRLMPQLQIFFILLPAQILISLFIFFITLGSVLVWFTDHFYDSIKIFEGIING